MTLLHCFYVHFVQPNSIQFSNWNISEESTRFVKCNRIVPMILQFPCQIKFISGVELSEMFPMYGKNSDNEKNWRKIAMEKLT